MNTMPWVKVLCHVHKVELPVVRRVNTAGTVYDVIVEVKSCDLCLHEAKHSAGG